MFRAADELEARDVALKLLEPSTDGPRSHRETDALNLLRLAGVARMFDQGRVGDRRFIVLELIDGQPFPGCARPARWADIADVTLELLRTLQRVHAAGVVHRDLKPANILVADGRPVLLDFGLARGDALGSTITESGTVMGTPRYLAPEQVRGARTDARTDLYAVGVMLYEALAGHPPHGDRDGIDALLHRKLLATPRPLQEVAEDLPRHVAATVARLLSVDPNARPASAAEAHAALTAGRTGGFELPWLGDTAAVDAIVEAVRARRPLRLVGGVGAGKSRALREAAARLAALDYAVEWLPSGQRPFSSLAPLLSASALAALPVGELDAAAASHVVAWLGPRRALFVDGPDGLDRWSRRVLEGVDGAIVTAARDGDGLTLAPLDEVALRPLFEGPDRLLHRREDGARLLHARSGGVPGRVGNVLAEWLASGVARWVDDRVRLVGSVAEAESLPTLPPGVGAVQALPPEMEGLLAWLTLAGPHARTAILAEAMGRASWEVQVELQELADLDAAEQRDDVWVALRPAIALSAWTPTQLRAAYRALAVALPPTTPGRFAHLLAAGDPAALADEGLAAARAARHAGGLDSAIALAWRALMAIRAAGEAALIDAWELPLLTELVKAALAHQSPKPLERARYALDAAQGDDDGLVDLEMLVDAGLATFGGRVADAERLAAGLAPSDEELQVWCGALRLRAAAARGIEAEETVMEALRPWAEASSEAVRGRFADWQGKLRYRQARPDEAIPYHREAVERATDVPTRLAALTNLSLAELDAGALDDARRTAARAGALARAHRLPAYELYAEWVSRSAAYRAGASLTPDLELVEAVRALDEPGDAGPVLLNEAAVAWRAGDAPLAARLAAEAGEAMRGVYPPPLVALADALHLVAVQADGARFAPVVAVAAEGAMPRVCRQVLALAARAGARVPTTIDDDGAGAVAHPDLRDQVLSPREVEAALGTARE